MKYLLVLLVLLNITDGILSHFLIEFGLGIEGNPFLYQMVGEPGFIILKVTGILICAFILWDIYRRHPRLAFTSTSIFVSVYTFIVAWNSSIFFM